MYEYYSGYCEKEGTCEICVEYVDSSTREGIEFEKLRFKCEHMDSSNPKCKRMNCPIFKNSPKIIRK